jgi:PPOX class probable F420-dependent enzyme
MAKLSEKARKLIDGKNLAFLGTLTEDGSPHVSPVWIDRDGDDILFNTATGRVKERNLRRDPRIALSVAGSLDSRDKVDIRGKVVEFVEGTPAEEHIHSLSRKYQGTDFDIPAGQQRVLVRVRPSVVHDGR